MTTKLVICDIDATLVNEKKELTPRTKKNLIQLHEKGMVKRNYGNHESCQM